jgi:hypothetical protein
MTAKKDIQPKASAGFKASVWKSILARIVAHKISKISRNTRNQATMRKNRKAAKIATPKLLVLDLNKMLAYLFIFNQGLVKQIRDSRIVTTVSSHIYQGAFSSNIIQPNVL